MDVSVSEKDEPRCGLCGRRIRLGTDGYTQSGRDYWCEACAGRRLRTAPVGNVVELFPERTDSSGGRVRVGRNDPCPCGSGKKYKRCCLGKEDAGDERDDGPVDGLEELRELIKEQDFGSLEELQTFVHEHMGARNMAPVDDFHGLSPEQMHRFLHFPFSSPELVVFSERLATPPEAPVVKLFGLLVDVLGAKGVKATAKGNLPLTVVREAALLHWSDEERRIRGAVRTERDCFDLHVTRLLGGIAGLIRKYQGRFVPTARLRKLMANGGMAAVYPLLLRTFVEKFNWAYRDFYPAFAIIQYSFLFNLLLFHRFGGEWRPAAFYEDSFLRAFPMVLKEAELNGSTYSTPEERVRHCYTLRSIERFAAFFGLLEIERESVSYLDRRIRARKTPLLDEAVSFRV